MRKLFAVAVGYALAGLIAHYFLAHSVLLWAALVCLGLGIITFVLPKKIKYHLVLAFFGAAVCMGWTWAHYELFILPAESCAGQTVTISARVTDYPDYRDGYNSLKLRCTDKNFPHVKMTVYDYGKTSGDLRPGDKINIEVRIKSALTKYGEETDSFVANGVFSSGYTNTPIEKTGTWLFRFLYWPQTIAFRLARTIDRIWPKDVNAFMHALLLGDKSGLYESLDYTVLQFAGMSHIVAVSGMHLGFLLGLIMVFTGRKRITAMICLPLIVVFAAMTGFTPSIVRASIMAGMLLLAPILRRENDSLTALSAAGLLILLINPQTIGAISFQLSFASMAGIILMGDKMFAWLRSFRLEVGKREYAIPVPIAGIIAASFAAAVFTLPISALHFGYVTVCSVLSNLLSFWAVSLTFVLGYTATFIGMAVPILGKLIAFVAAFGARYVIWVARLFAGLPGTILYTHDVLTAGWLIFTYAVFITAWCCRGQARMRFVPPVCASIIGLCLVQLLSVGGDGMTVTAVDVGQGESIAITTRSSTVVIDCGGGNISGSAATRTCQELSELGRTNIDLLILTHPHADHANGVGQLLTLGIVDRIMLAYDEEYSETCDEIISLAQRHGTEVYCLEGDTRVDCGELSLDVYVASNVESVNDRGLVIVGDYGEYEFLAMGDAGTSTEVWLTENYVLPDAELLIVGHHGSNTSTGEEFLNAIRPETAIISVGYNTYGHPTSGVLQRLQQIGAQVHRTDEEGSVTIRVAPSYGN